MQLHHRTALLAVVVLDGAALLRAQQPTPQGAPVSVAVAPIAAPRVALPPEAASAAVTPFSFLVYGDTRGRRDGTAEQYEHSQIVESMLLTIRQMANGPEPVKFVLQSGDAVVNGQDARQWNVSFVGLVNRLTTEGGVPYFLVPGNHEYGGRTDQHTGLTNYLRAMSGLIPPEGSPRRLTDYPTYAFGYGNVFVLGIDSDIASDTTQLRWATAQLQGLDRKRYTHVVAFFHHPIFSSGPHGTPVTEKETADMRALYMPLFREQHVDLLFAGHDHLFDHWVERYADASGHHRIDQIVSGGGGAPLYAYEGEPDLHAYLVAGRPDSVRVQHLVRPGPSAGDNPYHYLIVHVDGDRVWLDVVGVDWGRGFAPYRTSRATLGDPPSQQP